MRIVEVMDSAGGIHSYQGKKVTFYQEETHCRIYEEGEKYAIASFLNYVYVKMSHKTEVTNKE